MFQRFSRLPQKGFAALAQYPATGFFILLGLLFGTIALGHLLRTPEAAEDDTAAQAKETTLFNTATDTAFVTVPAEVRKENVVHIVALAPGIVSTILTVPGRPVSSGQTLLTLTSDYQSGSTDLQKKLAAESARLTQELAKIDKRITQLEEKKTRHDAALSSTEEDIELENLKKDRATRKSSLKQSTLSVELAERSDAVFKPKVFTAGIVESIAVKRGDFVTAGQTLATVSTPRGATTLEAFLDPKTARLFDATKEARVEIGDEVLTLRPTYFSQSENEQGLFPVLFALSDETTSKIINGEFLKIALPLRSEEGTILLPIDAIFQDDQASVLIERDGQAVSKVVPLGQISGGFVAVRFTPDGLASGDRVILNRAVVAGDRVSSIQ